MILQVRSSAFVFMPVGVSAYCLGRAWSLILILMLLSHPLIYSTRAERSWWPWQPSVFPWRNFAWMVSSSLNAEIWWSVPRDFAKQKRLTGLWYFLRNLLLRSLLNFKDIWTGGQSCRSSMHQYPSGFTHSLLLYCDLTILQPQGRGWSIAI